MEAFFNRTNANASADASANTDSSMPMTPDGPPNVGQNHHILDILRLLIDNYSRSHQMYMIPIESMIYRMNSSSPTDTSMLFHLQNNTHRRMNEYHHTMRDILQLIRQIHQSSSSPPTPTPPPPIPDFNRSPSRPTSNRIAESILNALLQSSSTNTTGGSTAPYFSRNTGPLTEASFTFSMFAGEDEEEPHLPVTDEQMRQYTETYIYQPPIFTSHYQEDMANEVGPNEVGSNEPEVRPIEPDADSNHRTCPITLEDFEPGESVIKINVCGHVFREAALRSWFERHRMCPVCRRDITVSGSGSESS